MTGENGGILAGYTRAAASNVRGNEEQAKLLERFGIKPDWIIAENAKNRTLERLDSLIEDLGAGDTIVCATLDRLGETEEALHARLLRIIGKGISVRTAAGDLFITNLDKDLLSALANAAKRLRQEKAGRAPRAKRASLMTEEKIRLIDHLLSVEPRLSRQAIADRAGISRARLYQHISKSSSNAAPDGPKPDGMTS